jgi:hypothetical protein
MPGDSNKPISSTELGSTRRAALLALGAGAVAAMGSSILAPAAAAQTPLSERVKVGTFEIAGAERLGRLQAGQLKALNLTRRLPMTTPITSMGLTREGVAELTPAARRLNKADLEALGRGQVTNPRVKDLSVADLASVRRAFGTQYRPVSTDFAIDISCCCCTPCCCAAAVASPLALAA